MSELDDPLREQIRRSAEYILIWDGFAKFTVKAVVKHVGVKEHIVRKYFSSRDALLHTALLLRFEALKKESWAKHSGTKSVSELLYVLHHYEHRCLLEAAHANFAVDGWNAFQALRDVLSVAVLGIMPPRRKMYPHQLDYYLSGFILTLLCGRMSESRLVNITTEALQGYYGSSGRRTGRSLD